MCSAMAEPTLASRSRSRSRAQPVVDGPTPYLRARAIEGRLYPDSLVASLPRVPDDHPLAGEWRLRADSAARLTAYVATLAESRGHPLAILEIGCGNGWLANALAGVPGTDVVGLDVNHLELEQARRVFRAPNLSFLEGDVRAFVPTERPDVIVLASVVQYVPDVATVLRRLAAALASGGELHVLDSPIYATVELAAARARTVAHYDGIGVPEMVEAYHHHSWDDFASARLNLDVLYRPDALVSRFERRLLRWPRSPFPWLRIRVPAASSPPHDELPPS